MAVLPDDYSEYPIFWTDEEWKYIEGSSFSSFIKEEKRKLKNDYDLISKSIPFFSTKFSLREFMETYKTVTSRTFSHDGDSIVMIPLADFFNHKFKEEGSTVS